MVTSPAGQHNTSSLCNSQAGTVICTCPQGQQQSFPGAETGGGGSYLFKCSCMIRSDMLKHINPWWENIIKNYPAKVTCFLVLKVKTVIFPCKICSTYTKVLRVYFNLLIVYVLSWVLSPLDKYNYVITRTKVRPAAQIRRVNVISYPHNVILIKR